MNEDQIAEQKGQIVDLFPTPIYITEISEETHKKTLEKIKEKPPSNKLELFSLKNRFKPGAPLLLHDEPIYQGGKIIGYTTSSNFSFCYKKNICLGYIKREIAENDEFFIEVEGKKHALNLEKQPIHDPRSEKMRS